METTCGCFGGLIIGAIVGGFVIWLLVKAAMPLTDPLVMGAAIIFIMILAIVGALAGIHTLATTSS